MIPKVAEVATHILDGAVTVRGFDKLDTQVGIVDREQPYTMLFRTNAALIEEGVRLLEADESIDIDIDTRGYTKKLEAMVLLFNEAPATKIKHEDVCIFENWAELMEEVELVKAPGAGKVAESGSGILHAPHARQTETVLSQTEFPILSACSRVCDHDTVFGSLHEVRGRRCRFRGRLVPRRGEAADDQHDTGDVSAPR